MANLKNQKRLYDMARIVMKVFGVESGFYDPILKSKINSLTLMQSEELIRELRAILAR